jgi:hypothetical protein
MKADRRVLANAHPWKACTQELHTEGVPDGLASVIDIRLSQGALWHPVRGADDWWNRFPGVPSCVHVRSACVCTPGYHLRRLWRRSRHFQLSRRPENRDRLLPTLRLKLRPLRPSRGAKLSDAPSRVGVDGPEMSELGGASALPVARIGERGRQDPRARLRWAESVAASHRPRGFGTAQPCPTGVILRSRTRGNDVRNTSTQA